MKRVLALSIVGGLLLALPALQPALGKAHVRLTKLQVCHILEDQGSTAGVAITVSENSLKGHLGHGDCQLPACDFNNIFRTGDLCNRESEEDGECTGLTNPRDDAGGLTPGCPAGTF